MRKAIIVLIPSVMAAAFVAACSSTQLQTAQMAGADAARVIQLACQDAQAVTAQAQAELHGGALGTANSIGAYIAAGCGTADAVAKLASDPTSPQWIGQLIGRIEALIAAKRTNVA